MAQGPRETKMNEKIEKRKQARKLQAKSLKKITSTENSRRDNSQEKRILTIPEEFKHIELGEIISR